MIRLLTVLVLCSSWPVLANAQTEAVNSDITFDVRYQKETDPKILNAFKMDEGPILPPIGPTPGGGGGGDPGTGTPGGDWTIPPYYPPYNPGGGSGFNLDQIVNIAREAWQVIQQGKPSATVASMNANALPEGARSAHDLQGWVKTPKVILYTVNFKSMGQTIGYFKFRIGYTYGGNVDGRGKYLTSVKVVPADYKVPWNNVLDAKSEVQNTYSIEARDNPTAVMEFLFSWTLSGTFKFTGGSKQFVVRGDGSFEDISDGKRKVVSKPVLR